MRKRRRRYSKGELNHLVDDLLHPLYGWNPELMILDVVLHSAGSKHLILSQP